jgi:hypothetical protein
MVGLSLKVLESGDVLLLLLGRPLLPFNIANPLQNPTDSQSKNRHAAAGALVDVWSAGTLLYTMPPLALPLPDSPVRQGLHSAVWLFGRSL